MSSLSMSFSLSLLRVVGAAARQVRAGLLRRRPEDAFAVETLASAVTTVLATRVYVERYGQVTLRL